MRNVLVRARATLGEEQNRLQHGVSWHGGHGYERCPAHLPPHPCQHYEDDSRQAGRARGVADLKRDARCRAREPWGVYVRQDYPAVMNPFSCPFLGCEIVSADVDRRDGFITSVAGQEVQKKLYNETMAEMGNYVAVPSYLAAKA